MKAVFKVISSFLFFASFLFCFADTAEDGDTLPDENKNVSEGITCAEMPAIVEEAADGMDMTSFVLVGQTVTQATQTLGGDSDQSAKRAHQGNMAIQGALSAAALTRYTKCKDAIDDCETTCAGSLPANQQNLVQCRKHSSTCSEAGLQALLSAMQAATSYYASKQLGDDCEGEDCNTPPPPPPTPSSFKLPPISGYAGIPGGNDLKDQDFGSIPFEGLPNPGELREEENPSNGPHSEKDLQEHIATSSFSSPSRPAQPQNLMSKGFIKDDGSFDSQSGSDEDDGDYSAENSEPYSAQRGLSSAFTSGTTDVAQQRKGIGSRSYRGSSGKAKLALNKKKLASDENLKRDVFSSVGAHASIFEKMSLIIQSYCASGSERCLEVGANVKK